MHRLLRLLLQASDGAERITQVTTERRMLSPQLSIVFEREIPGVQTSFEFRQRREAPFEHWGQFWDDRAIDIMPEKAKMRCQALLKLLKQALLTTSGLLQELLFALLE